MAGDAPSVFDRLSSSLEAEGADFSVMKHAPVATSAEAAAIRGTPLASGAKALVCKADGQFVMFVMSADRKLSSKLVRSSLGWKSLRFADATEVAQITGLPPGAIPPFGQLFGLPTYCDDALAEHARINFNAGDRAISISLAYADYIRIANPTLGNFAELPASEA